MTHDSEKGNKFRLVSQNAPNGSFKVGNSHARCIRQSHISSLKDYLLILRIILTI